MQVLSVAESSFADRMAVFAFYATLLLSCHYGPENVEYSGKRESMFKEISLDVVSSLGKEYSEVMKVLESRVPDGDCDMRDREKNFSEENKVEGVSGKWIVIVDKGWCFLAVSRHDIVVESSSSEVREDIKKKLRNVGERIQDTLLPIPTMEE